MSEKIKVFKIGDNYIFEENLTIKKLKEEIEMDLDKELNFKVNYFFNLAQISDS
jgi:hypothetical protein